MILVVLAEGFEEIEALTPVDMMRRASLPVKTVAIGENPVTGAHGISVVADLTSDEVTLEEVEHLILPGGMPGSLNLDASPFVDALIKSVSERGGHIGAICAAPLVLGRRGLLRGKRATCFPGFEEELLGAEFVKCETVTDGRITTACGMEAALAFAKELVRVVSAETVAKHDDAQPSAQMVNESGIDANEYLNDEKFVEAVRLSIENGAVSCAYLQRKLRIGYGRVALYIDVMEALGIIGGNTSKNPRKICITMEEWEKIYDRRA